MYQQRIFVFIAIMQNPHGSGQGADRSTARVKNGHCLCGSAGALSAIEEADGH
jgi:hypothetical protein